MKKIIFSDYDGTIDTKEGDIFKNIEAIKNFRNNGNMFVIATGRSYVDLKRKLDLYPIPFDYLILNHGGVILDKLKNVIDACTIPKNIGTKICNSIKYNKNVERIILFDILKKDIDEISDNLTKIMIEMKDELSAKELSKQINDNWCENIKSYVIPTKKIEVISKYTDKGKAIEKILKIEDIPNSNVFTIGDGANDVEMILKYDGYGMKKSEEIIYSTTNKLVDSIASLIEMLSDN